MNCLPRLDVKTNTNHSPHVLILGAGASRAAFLKGDRNGRKLPVMKDLVETLGLDSILAMHGIRYNGEDFESLYSKLCADADNSELIKKLNNWIERYFACMYLPNEATLYDYIILSLRSKDTIATFNWDPLLSEAYTRNQSVLGHENMPKILFLHGNVSQGACTACKTKGWRYNSCLKCSKQFSATNLLYPVENKDYTLDPFIRGEWEDVKTQINEAYFITIFGYSAPKTDVEARKIMHDAWSKNRSKDLTVLSLIDLKDQNELIENWRDFEGNEKFWTIKDFFDSPLAIYPRRTCEAYAMATLQQSPWKENRFPKIGTVSLTELQEWVRQLIDEEKSGHLTGNPFNKL